MSSAKMTRWFVSVSKDTDTIVRTHLSRRGLNRGDLSKFVAEAVVWRVFDQTVDDVRKKLVDIPTEKMEAVIDEAVASVRRRRARKAG